MSPDLVECVWQLSSGIYRCIYIMQLHAKVATMKLVKEGHSWAITTGLCSRRLKFTSGDCNVLTPLHTALGTRATGSAR